MRLKVYLYVGIAVALVGLAFTVNLQHNTIKQLQAENAIHTQQLEAVTKSIQSLESLRDEIASIHKETIIIEKEIRNLPDEQLEEEANKISDQIFERFNR